MKIYIQFPTRKRVYKAFEVLKQAIALADNPDQLFINISIDTDDFSQEYVKVLNYFTSHGVKCNILSRENKNKVEAINAVNVNDLSGYDILLVLSDDMIPKEQGWDTIIKQYFKNNSPELDACLWLHDGYQRSISTIPCMGVNYYLKQGYIYHPDYQSLWCDNEYTDVAVSLDKMIMQVDGEGELFRHEHPANNAGVTMDELYKRNEALYNADKEVYEKRKSEKFGLNITDNELFEVILKKCGLPLDSYSFYKDQVIQMLQKQRSMDKIVYLNEYRQWLIDQMETFRDDNNDLVRAVNIHKI